MPVPFTNMEDIVYCHNEELAKEIFVFLMQKGYPVGLSVSVINTGTHGEQVVKKLDVYKKKDKVGAMEFTRYSIVRFKNGYVEYVGEVTSIIDDSVWVRDVEDGLGHLIHKDNILEVIEY